MNKGRSTNASSLCLFLGFLIAACSPEVGPSYDWMETDQIEAPFRPETGPVKVVIDPVPSIRVATFNVHHGEDVEALADAIDGTPALKLCDVILIQEIQAFPREGGSRARRLAEALQMGFVYAPARTFDEGTHGLAILSRHPLNNIAVMELPRGGIVVDTERRVALRADILLAAGYVRLVNVHLDTRLNATERILQLRPALLNAPSPVIVGGDFNTNPLIWAFNLVPILPWSATGISDQASVLDDYMMALNFQTPTAELGETVDFPVLKPRVDAIYPRGLITGERAVERGISVSDHWPVWLEVTPPPSS